MIWSKKQEAALIWILVRSNPMKNIESILPLPKTAGQQSYFLYFKLSEASKKVTKAQTKPLLYSQLSSILSFSTVNNVKKITKFQITNNSTMKKVLLKRYQTIQKLE